MATMIITDHCTNCGACVEECPNDAISWPADADCHVIDPDKCTECVVFVIDPLLCTECVGFHGAEACQMVCPVECCLPDPSRPETEAELLEKAKRLHPSLANRLAATPKTSRFQNGQATTSVNARLSEDKPTR